jgi:hypothetical protein
LHWITGQLSKNLSKSNTAEKAATVAAEFWIVETAEAMTTPNDLIKYKIH